MNLTDIFKAVHKELTIELEKKRAAINHAATKGVANEDAFTNVLLERLPAQFGIDGGFLVDKSGNISKQLDLIIFDDRGTPSLYVGGGARVIPAECAYAVIEIKTDLSGNHIKECIENKNSVKALARTAYYESNPIEHSHSVYGGEFKDYPILYFVFAYESATLETINKFLEIDAAGHPLHERVDCLLSLNRGLLANQGPEGLTAIPSPTSQIVIVEENALLIFYALITHMITQVQMRKFNFTYYINDLTINFRVPT